jgi:hypothetical protein
MDRTNSAQHAGGGRRIMVGGDDGTPRYNRLVQRMVWEELKNEQAVSSRLLKKQVSRWFGT